MMRVWRLSGVCLMSVCLSVAYIGLKSRTEMPRKTKIGTEVAHMTPDSDTTFKERGILWRPPTQLVIYVSQLRSNSEPLTIMLMST